MQSLLNHENIKPVYFWKKKILIESTIKQQFLQKYNAH